MKRIFETLQNFYFGWIHGPLIILILCSLHYFFIKLATQRNWGYWFDWKILKGIAINNRQLLWGAFSSSNAGWVLYCLMNISAFFVVIKFSKVLDWARLSLLTGISLNFLERILCGQVLDYLQLYITKNLWVAFNLPDLLIIIGFLCLNN